MSGSRANSRKALRKTQAPYRTIPSRYSGADISAPLLADRHIPLAVGLSLLVDEGVGQRLAELLDAAVERAVRLVREERDQHPSEWAAITSVAGKLGCGTEALRKWLLQAQKDTGERPGLTTSDAERLRVARTAPRLSVRIAS